ncbi:MAG: hypothetical protein ACTSQJ_08455 [Promethearchaeota archaeon]
MGKFVGVCLIVIGLLVAFLFGLSVIYGLFKAASSPNIVIREDIFALYIFLIICGISLLYFGIKSVKS